jgi:ABC-type uncharacterized transport system ATPase subunit
MNAVALIKVLQTMVDQHGDCTVLTHDLTDQVESAIERVVHLSPGHVFSDGSVAQAPFILID